MDSLGAALDDESDLPPQVSPAPLFTPVLAGFTASGVSAAIQTLTHSGRTFAPTPLTASMPAIAAFFTTYEIIKQELGLSPTFPMPTYSPHHQYVAEDMSADPRSQLFNGEYTMRYLAAATAAGGLSQLVKLPLTPGTYRNNKQTLCVN